MFSASLLREFGRLKEKRGVSGGGGGGGGGEGSRKRTTHFKRKIVQFIGFGIRYSVQS